LKQLDDTSSAINAAHFEYDPLAIDPSSGNSNSALWEWLHALNREGVPFMGDNHPWIPGYHEVL
jgi:hypothetical protein